MASKIYLKVESLSTLKFLEVVGKISFQRSSNYWQSCFIRERNVPLAPLFRFFSSAVRCSCRLGVWLIKLFLSAVWCLTILHFKCNYNEFKAEMLSIFDNGVFRKLSLFFSVSTPRRCSHKGQTPHLVWFLTSLAMSSASKGVCRFTWTGETKWKCSKKVRFPKPLSSTFLL